MINVQEFLKENMKGFDCYCLVTYDNETYPIHFNRHNFNGEDWFLESPCEVYTVSKNCGDIYSEKWINYVKSLLEEGEDIKDYIKNYLEPMIVDNVLYEIEAFQCEPYLPKEVDNIKIITERECLLYVLEKNK